MSKRTRTAAVDDMTHRFDLGDASDFADGPTVLPGPWSPPPDPGFLTGTVLRIDRAIETFDSAPATVRFSREEVRALVGELGDETAALPLRVLPSAARAATPRTVSLFRRYGWLALQLALAFVAGVLTGVIAVR